MENLVLFGAPGVGKGTHAGILAEKYNLLHLSTGDMLRAEIQSGSPLGERVRAKMEKGDLVGDDVVIALVDKALASTNSGVILDGFPRTVQQEIYVVISVCHQEECLLAVNLQVLGNSHKLLGLGGIHCEILHNENSILLCLV